MRGRARRRTGGEVLDWRQRLELLIGPPGNPARRAFATVADARRAWKALHPGRPFPWEAGYSRPKGAPDA